MDTFCPNPKSIYKNFEKKFAKKLQKKLKKICKKIAKKLQKSCKKIAKKLQKSCKMRKRNFLLCKIFAKFLQILNLHTDFRPREESVISSNEMEKKPRYYTYFSIEFGKVLSCSSKAFPSNFFL